MLLPIRNFTPEVMPEFLDEPVFDLAHPLSGNTMPGPDLLKGQGLFRQEAGVQNVQFLVAQRLAKFRKFLTEHLLELCVRQNFFHLWFRGR
jgi:hypothetical protein